MIGDTFAAELRAAGLEKAAWLDDGTLANPEVLTEEERSAYASVLSSHDPDASVPPDRVSRRQFMLQLEISGLTESVSAWVASQSALVQIAFRESGTLVKTDEAMTAGFASMGFSEAQIDEFFKAASRL